METEFIERIKGVGALIVSSNRRNFLTIEELRTKRSTNRLAGQGSLPMETVHYGESLEDAFDRLAREEIQLTNCSLRSVNSGVLGRIELAEATVLHAHFFEMPEGSRIILGSEVEEVENPKWISFNEVMQEPRGSLRLRAGVWEVVSLYLQYKEYPDAFQPKICRFSDLRVKIPKEVFDLVEKGATVGEALYRFGLPLWPAVDSLATHLQNGPQYSSGVFS